MKARSVLLSALLFLCGGLIAQPYSQPPYLYSDISSIGNYNFAGKKFFVSSLMNYNTLVRRDEYISQKNAFTRYLVESLIMRGAVPVKDSLAADFYVTASVYYTGITEDVTDYSKASKAAGYRPVNYHEELKIKRKESSNPNAKITRDKLTSRPVSKMHDMVYREEGYIVKTVTVEAFEPVNGTISSIWKTRALDSHTEIERLPSDCAMVYLMMRGYGKEMDERKCGISKEDPYFVAFEKHINSKDIIFLPDSESSDKDMSLFLVKKSEVEIVCLIEDNHLLSTDELHKNYRAAIKAGNKAIECSKMYYDMRPVQYSRFLTLVFPADGADLKDFDIVFYKKNNPKKIKQAIKNVLLN